MANENILLSISVLVSNNIATIKNCMDSILPILETIPSELIVVDTGGSDGSIEIARQYAHKVVPFTWCNDFAKARNAGLKQARGRWFMYLDDDEWFQDVQEIIDFFQSGEHEDYYCASYAVRDYLDKTGTRWSNTRASRMVRRETNTKFVSPIHEVLVPRYAPEKFFTCYTNHYGYAFENEEERRKHTERNVSLLTKVLETDKSNHRLMMQLAQEYCATQQYEKSIEVSKKDLEAIDQETIKSEDAVLFGGWHMNNIVNLEILIDDSEEAYKDASSYLEKKWINNVTKNNISQALVRLTFEANRKEECLSHLELYLETYDRLQKKEEEKLHQTITYQGKSYSDENYYQSLRAGLLTAKQLGRKEKVLELLKRMVVGPFFFTTIEDFVEIINILWGISEQPVKLQLLEAMMKKDDFRKALVTICKVEVEAISLPKEELWVYLAEYGEIHKADFPLEQWIKHIYELMEKISWKRLLAFKEVLISHRGEEKRLLLFKRSCFEKILSNPKMEELNYAQATELLYGYTETVIKLNASIYRDDFLTSRWEVYVPANYRFSLEIEKMKTMGEDNLKKAKLIRKAVEVYPPLSSFGKLYLKKMQQETKEATDEFLKLAAMIKKSIRMYLNMGQIENARLTFEQLEKLIPEDPEIVQLKQLLV